MSSDSTLGVFIYLMNANWIFFFTRLVLFWHNDLLSLYNTTHSLNLEINIHSFISKNSLNLYNTVYIYIYIYNYCIYISFLGSCLKENFQLLNVITLNRNRRSFHSEVRKASVSLHCGPSSSAPRRARTERAPWSSRVPEEPPASSHEYREDGATARLPDEIMRLFPLTLSAGEPRVVLAWPPARMLDPA